MSSGTSIYVDMDAYSRLKEIQLQIAIERKDTNVRMSDVINRILKAYDASTKKGGKNK